jgi:hypothetical protein
MGEVWLRHGGAPGAGQRDGTRWRGRLQDPGGLSCGNLLRVAARDQIAEHGVEPARDLVTVPGQVTVALGPDLQDRRVVIGDNLTAALLRCAFPEQRRSMIWMVRWVQMASARSSKATRSRWRLEASVAMS